MSSRLESLNTADKGAPPYGGLRTTANNAVLHLHPARVPASALRITYTWGLGGISATLAVIMALTGVLLMFRYEPTVERAYMSIQALEAEVMFGSLVRAVHHWAGNLLAITSFLHLVRVFLTGGFKKGRAVNWVVGIALFLIVLIFNFTGYLLPWDQLAYWAVTVVTSMITYIPLVGDSISGWVLGGTEVGQGALNNFYALHVAVLPALIIAFLGYHFWKVRKDGGISQPEPPRGQPVKKVRTIPHLIRIELAAMLVVMAAVLIFAMIVPAPLEDLANHSPNQVQPLTQNFQGYTLHELPPNTQAIGALIMLGILENTDLLEYPVDSAESLHLQIEAMKLAFSDIHRHVADPEYMRVSSHDLLDPEYLRQRARLIEMDRARFPKTGIPQGKGTVYLTTADASGMTVSFIQSNYVGFGSGIVVPGTGIRSGANWPRNISSAP